MIEGFIGDWRVRVQLEKDPKDENESLAGYWIKDVSKQQGLVSIDINAGAIAMLNVLLHEPLHGLADIYGLKLKHKDIYIIASALTQFLISTRIIDPLAVEARVRKLAAEDIDPELTE